jgi:hypothetical protein
MSLESESSWDILHHGLKRSVVTLVSSDRQFFSYVVAVASDEISVNVGSAGHIRFRYVMLDCA